jgi:hypothetical protein
MVNATSRTIATMIEGNSGAEGVNGGVEFDVAFVFVRDNDGAEVEVDVGVGRGADVAVWEGNGAEVGVDATIGEGVGFRSATFTRKKSSLPAPKEVVPPANAKPPSLVAVNEYA